ncbi:MAG TPA: asparagine synthase (glutamine-hydrolyzing) [Puia sp.]|jgi:asparagine synthase (glutamine-hydrolysing)|nr:asparagine synthase (glutamine-hydrolyzing) [Puia sp.]
MCGFAGILNNAFSIHRSQLAGISRKVSFRGPDSNRLCLYDNELCPAEFGNTALFFNRLAIIDLDARSDQPFENDRYTLVFNGEIYNYRELKKELQGNGFVFRTSSDTEVLLYALQLWGKAALTRLNGMFAFFLLDREKRSFLLARDRMGIKPLYYRLQHKTLLFASELDSLLRLSADLPPIEPAAVEQFLWTQFIPSPFTIVRGAFKLPPGHYIEGNWDQLQRQQPVSSCAYWDAYRQAAAGETPSSPAALEAILVDSLSRQLVADVPLGLFLSSGVDSSLLAALVNRHFGGSGNFNFFTVAFAEATASDESRDALDFIKGFNNPALISHTLKIDPQFMGDHIDTLYDYFDEPFGDPTSLLNWVISQKAKEFVTVALSGDGADELFWGYNRYEQWCNPSLQMPRGLSFGRPLADWLRPLLPGKYRRTKAALELEPDPVKRHFSLFLSPAFGHLRSRPVWDQPVWALQGIENIRQREDLVTWLDIKTYLADAMLHKVDRASMAASLEVRVPYLDNKVVDYALALPFSDKSNRQFRHKAVLKQLLQRLAPHYEINRPKKGFNFPLDRWLRFEWKEKVLSLVNREELAALNLDEKLYGKMISRYYSGDRKLSIAVWYLFNLVLWHRKYKNIHILEQSL